MSRAKKNVMRGTTAASKREPVSTRELKRVASGRALLPRPLRPERKVKK